MIIDPDIFKENLKEFFIVLILFVFIIFGAIFPKVIIPIVLLYWCIRPIQRFITKLVELRKNNVKGDNIEK